MSAESSPVGTTNAYLVSGLLIDPAARTDRLDDAVAARGSATRGTAGIAEDGIDAIAATHTHSDHVDRFADSIGIAPDETFRDGDTVGESDVRVLDTPGHAPDHVAFGVGRGSGGRRRVPDELRRIRDAGFDPLYPGYGPPINDPAGVCQRLIDRRLERDRRVLAAVHSAASNVDSVLERAYGTDLTGVEDLARGTVRAHLHRLAAQGRIDGSRARE